MIYSRSAEYAIRALVHIATLPPGEFTMAKNIAADANIPAPFLAKILQDLTRDGFLKSNKGPGNGKYGGGFCFAFYGSIIYILFILEYPQVFFVLFSVVGACHISQKDMKKLKESAF